jgi:hypothetical protein
MSLQIGLYGISRINHGEQQSSETRRRSIRPRLPELTQDPP